MPDQLQLRGGTTTETNSFTGAAREVTVDTTKKTAVVHDGSTAGGNPLLREDGSNSALALGSQGTPSLKFTGDTNTGIYSPGADQVAISTDGQGRLFVDASGNVTVDTNTFYVDAVNNRVGVGTTSPAGKLDIDGGSSAFTVQFKETSGPWQRMGIQKSNNLLSFGEFNNTGDTFTPILNVSGDGDRVGIGTTSAGQKLEVANTSGLGSSVRVRDSAGYGDLTLYNNNWSFGLNGTERARIDSSGRLLVGTATASTGEAQYSRFVVQGAGTNPAVNAHISLLRGQNTATTPVSAGVSIGLINFADSAGNPYSFIEAETDGTTGTGDHPGRLVFSTTADGASSPTEAMRINSSRDVFIGRTDYITFGTNTTDGIVLNKSRLDVSAASLARITQTRDATGTFDRFYSGSSIVGSITTNGSATAYNTSSDYRLKENVTAVTDGITRLQQLKPSRFNFIADPDRTVDGFIAHEVQGVVPEAVTGTKDEVDENGDPVYQGIDQSKLVPLLTAALQEAIGEIESLKARVAALEAN